MPLEGQALAEDGVAVLARGDAVLIVYQRAARLHRTRWLFDRVDEYLAERSDDVVVFMVVLPTADPPDGPTRAENSTRLKKIGKRLRRLVTTPVGDAFRMSIVRTVMRGLAILQGQAGVCFVTNTIDDGLRRVTAVASPKTPSRARLGTDLESLFAALGVSDVPTFAG